MDKIRGGAGLLTAWEDEDMGSKQLMGMVLGALVGLLVGYVGRCTGGSV
jgi:hypothetical protein